MAKFKCKHSGTVLEFLVESDVAEMRRHEEYEEVLEEGQNKVEPVPPPPKKRKEK